MATVDRYHNTDSDYGSKTANVTADQNGTSVDLAGIRSALIVAAVGESGDTLSGSVYIELEVEHCNDDSTWVDCADADLLNSVTGNNTGTFAKIDADGEDGVIYTTQYVGTKRYVRVVINVTGSHSVGTPIGIVIVKGDAAKQPLTA